MTTTIKVHVNGNYRTTVKRITRGGGEEPLAVIDGDVEGGRETRIGVLHPATMDFRISEEPLTDEMKAGEKPLGYVV